MDAHTPDARAINARLRKGEAPTAEELAWFARGLASGAVTDAQAGDLLGRQLSLKHRHDLLNRDLRHLTDRD